MSVQELKSPKIKTLRNLKEIRFSDPVIKEHQQNIANKNAAKWSFGLATVLTFPAMKAFFINFKKREVVNSRIFWFDEYEMVTDWSSVILHGAFLWFVCFCISYIVLKKTNILDNKKAIKKLSIRLFSKNPRRAILLIFCAILFLLSLII